MARPHAKTQTNDLIDRLNELATSSPVDLQALAQVEFRARGLKNVDELEYHAVMGMIASLRADLAMLDSEYAASRVLAGDDPNQLAKVLINFAISYSDAGRPDVTTDLLIESVDKLSRDGVTMRFARQVALTSGMFGLFLEIHERVGDAINGRAVAWALDQVKARGVSMDDAHAFFVAIEEFLASHGMRRSSVTTLPVSEADQEGPCLLLRFSVPVGAEQAVRLEDELGSYLEGKQLKATERFAILAAFVPTESGDDNGADDSGRVATAG